MSLRNIRNGMSSFSKKEALIGFLFVFSVIIVVSWLIPFNYLRQMFFVERGFISGTSGKININVSGKFEKH